MAFERLCQLVRLEAARNADQQMGNYNGRSAHPLYDEMFAVPGFKPKFIVLAAGISTHVHEQTGELIDDHQHARRPGLQQYGKPFDSRIRNVEPRRDKIEGMIRLCRHRGWHTTRIY